MSKDSPIYTVEVRGIVMGLGVQSINILKLTCSVVEPNVLVKVSSYGFTFAGAALLTLTLLSTMLMKSYEELNTGFLPQFWV